MNYREHNFSWSACELCAVIDPRAHFYVSQAERNNLHVVEVNNRYFALIINEYTFKS